MVTTIHVPLLMNCSRLWTFMGGVCGKREREREREGGLMVNGSSSSCNSNKRATQFLLPWVYASVSVWRGGKCEDI